MNNLNSLIIKRNKIDGGRPRNSVVNKWNKTNDVRSKVSRQPKKKKIMEF